MVVKNTGLGFINGRFDNLTNGQKVALSYGGTNYAFAANYYGGSGNDLVLVWANNRPFAWGNDQFGQLGDNASGINRLVPVGGEHGFGRLRPLWQDSGGHFCRRLP